MQAVDAGHSECSTELTSRRLGLDIELFSICTDVVMRTGLSMLAVGICWVRLIQNRPIDLTWIFKSKIRDFCQQK